MPAFVEKYSQPQRDAIAYAYEDRNVRPAARVVELAAAGELTLNGEQLPAFKTNEDTVRHEARRLRRRRAGEETSELANVPPRDAIETLRRRLVSLADAELGELERQRVGKRSPEKMRQLARVVLEASRIPGPTDPRPASPATRDSDGKRGPEVRGGAAGALIKAHRATSTTPADDHVPETLEGPDTSPQNEERPADAGPPDDPAAYVRDAVARLQNSSAV